MNLTKKMILCALNVFWLLMLFLFLYIAKMELYDFYLRLLGNTPLPCLTRFSFLLFWWPLALICIPVFIVFQKSSIERYFSLFLILNLLFLFLSFLGYVWPLVFITDSRLT